MLSEKSIMQSVNHVKMMLSMDRMYKQQEEIAKLNVQAWGSYFPPEIAEGFATKARYARLQVKKTLVAIEEENGRRYLAGKPVIPLSLALHGRRFKSWVFYKRCCMQYAGGDIWS